MKNASFGRIYWASILANITLISLIVIVGIGILVLIGLVSQETPPKGKQVLTLTLSGQLIERPASSPLAQLLDKPQDNPKDILTLVHGIEKAAGDDQILALNLILKPTMCGFGKIEELRAALSKFRATGKPVVVNSAYLDTKTFYLALESDALYVAPESFHQISGLRAQYTFLHRMLKEIGVQVHIVRHGSFKSAGETVMQDSLSAENRLQMRTFQDDVWRQIESALVASGRIDAATLDKIVEQGFQIDMDLEAHGAVDGRVYELEEEEVIAEVLGDSVEFDLHNFGKYMQPAEPSWKHDIAVVYIDGEIPMDNGGGDQVDVPKVIKALKGVQEDDDIKGVVVRVNSPGGSSYASDRMWKAVKDLAETKPVYVSMGDYAASGGYYVSCPAERVFANPSTLTGSIGVFCGNL